MKNIITVIVLTLALTSCIGPVTRFDLTQEWDHEKMKKLQSSEKKFVIYYTNDLKTLSSPEFTPDGICGKVENYSNDLNRLKYRSKTGSGKLSGANDMLQEVHVFIAEEYRGQDRILISKDNFIQMREYSIDKRANIMSSLGSIIVILALSITALGTVAYYAYIRSTITLSL